MNKEKKAKNHKRLMMIKIKLLYDFFIFWAHYKDRKEAWRYAKIVNRESDLDVDEIQDDFIPYDELVSEAWNNYSDSHWIPPTNPDSPFLSEQLWGLKPMEHSRESFIIEARSNPYFSARWGLNFEERTLTDFERIHLLREKPNIKKSIEVLGKREPSENFSLEEYLKPYGVPKKKIIVTYEHNWSVTYE